MTEIFVFGSNLAGRHGKGAAKYAKDFYGAKYGVGYGPTGNSYAIPTKDEKLKTLPLEVIDMYVEAFINFAETNPDTTFLLTPIGCGLAGYKAKDIKSLFHGKLSKNIVLTSSWLDHF